jgi:hypothetical protein
VNALDDGSSTTDTMPTLQSDSAHSDFQVLESFNDPSCSSSASTAPSPDHGTKHPFASDKADIVSATNTISPSPDPSATELLKDQSHSSGIAHPKSPTRMIEDSITQMNMEDDKHNKNAVRRKKRKGNDREDEHPMPKKHKVDVKVADLLRPTTHRLVQDEKAKVQVKKVEKPGPQVSTKKRRGKVQVEVSIPYSASSRKRSKLHRPLPKASSSSSHLPLPITQDPATVALNAEICGMLIETMALSRASSLPLSSLYKMVMQTQPSLKSQRSESEWLIVFARVLQEGEAGRGSGVFGKVESSGKVCFLIYIYIPCPFLFIVSK